MDEFFKENSLVIPQKKPWGAVVPPSRRRASFLTFPLGKNAMDRPKASASLLSYVIGILTTTRVNPPSLSMYGTMVVSIINRAP